MFRNISLLTYLVIIICLLQNGDFLTLNITPESKTYNLLIDVNNTSIKLQITKDGATKQTALLGTKTNASNAILCPTIPHCVQFDDITLQIQNITSNSFDIEWKTNNMEENLQDCFDLERTRMHWFGGPEYFTQDKQFSAITEGYWLNSRGIFVYVHDKVPLFIDQNFQHLGYVCFEAKLNEPYRQRSELMLKYTIGVFNNPKEGHLYAVDTFLGKPKGHPNIEIIKHPIWSTWARYYRDINDSIVLNFAQEISSRGYTGQLEIDDDWETCYGSLEFSGIKFPQITNTLKAIKQLNFRTSLWIHPFVNSDCKSPSEYGLKNKLFVKSLNNTLNTSWWNSGRDQAYHVDFTNPESISWFNQRLNNLRDNIGVDTFKFDAGESSWPPQPPTYGDDKDNKLCPIEESPQCLTTNYVKNCAEFGDGIEVRTGWRTQYLPVFVRMIDKDSNWSFSNGLYTLITTLLQMNMNGYTMVLPDMVGGNGYYGKPSAELFVRWLQANTFMPAIQFSFVPWDYENFTEFNVPEISKKFINLHTKYAEDIKIAMDVSIEQGHPVNGPVWWVDPENPDAHKVSTQYLLGSDIVVAPVIMEKQNKRNVFLPEGVWIDGNTGDEYQGPQTIKDYPAPIDVLPYFIRK